MGTPGGIPSQPQQPIGGPEVQRTVLGMQAPQGLPSYADHRLSQPGPGMSNPQMQQYPGYPQTPQQGYPGYSQQGYPQQQQYPGYGGSGPMGAVPVDQMAPIEGKKSTLARDIGIGVGIAALVLVGFLAVKMLVLDKDSGSSDDSAAATSKFATVKLKMPPGMTAEMLVDDARVATVEDAKQVAVSPGTKRIKLVGTNGLTCDVEQVKLEAGKTTTLECGFGVGSGAATGSGSGSGSGTQVAQISGSGSGSGSGTKATDTKATDTKATDTKATATKATDTKATDTPTKPTDTQATDTKTKATDTKATDTKATDTKAAGDPTKGYLQVYSKPPAKILVDGVDTGMKTPISGQTLPMAPGKHKVTFVIGDDRFTYPVVIKVGSTETMSKDLQ
jgi:hypothetical protein